MTSDLAERRAMSTASRASSAVILDDEHAVEISESALLIFGFRDLESRVWVNGFAVENAGKVSPSTVPYHDLGFRV